MEAFAQASPAFRKAGRRSICRPGRAWPNYRSGTDQIIGIGFQSDIGSEGLNPFQPKPELYPGVSHERKNH